MKRSRGLISNPVTAQSPKVGTAGVEIPFNYLLRMLLGLVPASQCLLNPARRMTLDTITATGTAAKLRDANLLSRKVSIVNLGPNAAEIMEGGHVLAILQKNESRELPMKTTGEITAKAIGDGSPTAIVKCTTWACPSEDKIAGFVMFLCLDETGSIGTGGALAGLDVIDRFRNDIGDERILGIGFCSFGDIICQLQPVSEDLDAVRAQLQNAVDTGGPPFFQSGGGDTPEVGQEALFVAMNELEASEIANLASQVYIYLKTDTIGWNWDGWDGPRSNPAETNTRLNNSIVTKVWLEFGNAEQGTEEANYADTFPETPIVVHAPFDL